MRGDPAAGPEHRPGGRSAQLHRELRAHVDLSQADGLHPEVDRGHRRQGEEERRAGHAVRARAGRGAGDEEGDRGARPGADRAGEGAGGGGEGRRHGGRGAPQRGRGDSEQVPGRGGALGYRGQAAGAAGCLGGDRSPGAVRVDQSAQVEHRGAGQGEGDHQAGEGGSCSSRGHARESRGGSQGYRGRLEGGRERGEICEGLGGLPHAHGPVRRRDHGPQRQHVRFRAAHHGRPHGLLPFARHLAGRRGRADLRGRPDRHRADLRRYSRAGRQLRAPGLEGDGARQGVSRRADPRHGHAHRRGR